MSPPLRFLAAAIGGWACLRGAAWLPWPAEAERAIAHAAPIARAAAAAAPEWPPAPSVLAAAPVAPAGAGVPLPARWRRTRPAAITAALPLVPEAPARAAPPTAQPGPAPWAPTPIETSPSKRGRPGAVPRWSHSVWAFGRGGGDRLAAAPSLGGSQAGARIGYRLAGRPAAPVSLILRVAAPLGGGGGAEAAAALEWKPSTRLPLRIVAERRQALGAGGRSRFALFGHGGVDGARIGGGFRLDGYAQAGAAGRDLFADGGVRITRRVAGLGLGGGAWAAAQPGAHRVDVGPAAVLRLPGGRTAIAIDWRHRVAGNARPTSGPALTLSSDF